MLSIEELGRLVKSGKETENHDFKAEFHGNKAELIHDILCFLNCKGLDIKHLIFGVDNQGNIIGIQKAPKYKLADIIDILAISHINQFPEITYEKYILEGKIILCLHLKRNLSYVPYMLMKDIKEKKGKTLKIVRAGVYVRPVRAIIDCCS